MASYFFDQGSTISRELFDRIGSYQNRASKTIKYGVQIRFEAKRTYKIIENIENEHPKSQKIWAQVPAQSAAGRVKYS